MAVKKIKMLVPKKKKRRENFKRKIKIQKKVIDGREFFIEKYQDGQIQQDRPIGSYRAGCYIL